MEDLKKMELAGSMATEEKRKQMAAKLEATNNIVNKYHGKTKNNHYIMGSDKKLDGDTTPRKAHQVNALVAGYFSMGQTVVPTPAPTPFVSSSPTRLPTAAPSVLTTHWSCGIKVVPSDFTAGGGIDKHAIMSHKAVCNKYSASKEACAEHKTCQWLHFVVTTAPSPAPTKMPTLQPTKGSAIPTTVPTTAPTSTSVPSVSPTGVPTTIPTTLMEMLYGKKIPTKQPTFEPTASQSKQTLEFLQSRHEILAIRPGLEAVGVAVYRSYYTDPVPSQGVDGLPFGWERHLPKYTESQASSYISDISEHLASLRFAEARKLWFLVSRRS
jgi:hypothetical protein